MGDVLRGIRHCPECLVALQWLGAEGRSTASLTAADIPVKVPASWLADRAAEQEASRRAQAEADRVRRDEEDARWEAECARQAALDWSFARGLDVVYGPSIPMEGGWVVLPRSVLEGLAAIWTLPGKTWAYARAHLPDRMLAEVLENARLGEGDEPSDDDVVPGLGFDDDWPPIPEREMVRWAAQHEPQDTSALGDYFREWQDGWSITYNVVADEDLHELLERLRAAGAKCTRNKGLVRRAYGERGDG